MDIVVFHYAGIFKSGNFIFILLLVCISLSSGCIWLGHQVYGTRDPQLETEASISHFLKKEGLGAYIVGVLPDDLMTQVSSTFFSLEYQFIISYRDSLIYVNKDPEDPQICADLNTVLSRIANLNSSELQGFREFALERVFKLDFTNLPDSVGEDFDIKDIPDLELIERYGTLAVDTIYWKNVDLSDRFLDFYGRTTGLDIYTEYVVYAGFAKYWGGKKQTRDIRAVADAVLTARERGLDISFVLVNMDNFSWRENFPEIKFDH